MVSPTARATQGLALALVLAWTSLSGRAQTNTPTETLVYATGFEPAEGYSAAAANQSLWGQMGWVGEGSGGNGLVTNFFAGEGQQAFIGFAPPAPKDAFLNLWQPLGLTNISVSQPVVKFSVLMQVVDSTNGFYDDFRWSVYNNEGARLFSLDFDNSRLEIFYILDGTNSFVSTGFGFDNQSLYQISIIMDFARNNWMAIMNGQVVVDSQPITTVQSALDLGDVDAVWAIRQSGNAGNNYMLFDDYQVALEPTLTIPPIIEGMGRQTNGEYSLLVHGEAGLSYAVDVTTDFFQWAVLGTNTLPNGLWQFTDLSATNYPLSFYRARQTTP